ncbi:hypothetical protein [Pleurocapsa sp. PCC 7319]|uniref:hypothetical protein n=1 Tax=Pleurocapsa sp. PCC 7319 TaxID=118161 RepID=UPI000349F7AA|nr:hypothetical protein [Pleurocapsa sp. PCC 7319]
MIAPRSPELIVLNFSYKSDRYYQQWKKLVITAIANSTFFLDKLNLSNFVR